MFCLCCGSSRRGKLESVPRIKPAPRTGRYLHHVARWSSAKRRRRPGGDGSRPAWSSVRNGVRRMDLLPGAPIRFEAISIARRPATTRTVTPHRVAVSAFSIMETPQPSDAARRRGGTARNDPSCPASIRRPTQLLYGSTLSPIMATRWAAPAWVPLTLPRRCRIKNLVARVGRRGADRSGAPASGLG